MRWLLASGWTRERKERCRALAGLQILVIGFFTHACGEPDSHRAIVQRLIEVEGTPMPFDPSSLVHPVFTWSFKTPADLEPWEFGRSDWRLTARGVTLDGNATQPALTRAVALEANSIETLNVKTQNFHGSVELRWAGPAQTLQEPGLVAKASRGKNPASTRSVRFDLGDHPGWDGQIDKLRLAFTPNSDAKISARQITVRQITATRFRPELLTEAGRKPWKLELGNDVRNAFLALPERPLELDLEVPRQAELRFAIGVPGMLRMPVQFRIVAVSDKGSREILFEETLDVGDARWWQKKLDLSHLTGQVVSIRFESEVEARLTPETGFPAWV